MLERLLSNPTVGNLLLAVWAIVLTVWEVDRAWEAEGRAGAKRALKSIARWLLGYALLSIWVLLSLSWGGGDLKVALSIFVAGLAVAAGRWF